jgi:flavin reductase (DIM6/NTAB) family NADH-FMN oxidoreductase RutF
MMDIADYFGIQSGYSTDKCEVTNVCYSKGETLNVPVIDKSPWVYECELYKSIEIGEGAIYIGEIKNILVDEKIPDTAYGKIDMINIDPLIYSPGGYYSLGKKVGNVGDSRNIFK